RRGLQRGPPGRQAQVDGRTGGADGSTGYCPARMRGHPHQPRGRRSVLAAAVVAASLAAVAFVATTAPAQPAAANVLAEEIVDPTERPLGPITFLGDSVALGSLIYGPTVVDHLAAHGWGPIRARAGV